MARLRAELGYGTGETICVVAVGGSGVGTSLLRRAAEAHEQARIQLPALRTILVCGPRIDPTSMPNGGRARGARLPTPPPTSPDGVRRGSGPGRPDNVHGAGCRRHALLIHPAPESFRTTHPRRLPAAPLRSRPPSRRTDGQPRADRREIVSLVRNPVRGRPVETDGASRAAALIAELF